ncbi:MAG: hypothetical protein WKF43_12470 [Acidimicrobiales bacterium]
MLLVAGISVVAAAEPSIGKTATTLRLLLLVGSVLMAGRLFLDFQNAERSAESHRHILSELNSDAGITRPPLDGGSTTSLDRQLGTYAAATWPGRDPAEWPSLLASDLFERTPPTGLTISLLVVSVAAVAAALATWHHMSPAGERARRAQWPSAGGGAG